MSYRSISILNRNPLSVRSHFQPFLLLCLWFHLDKSSRIKKNRLNREGVTIKDRPVRIRYFQSEEIERKKYYESIIKKNQAECGKSCIARNGTWKSGVPYGRSHVDPCKKEFILKLENEDRMYCDEPVGNGCHHVFEGYLCLDPSSQHSLVISSSKFKPF